MDSWGTGPFDNDTAADWRLDFLDREPASRAGMIMAAFAATAFDGHLDLDIACEAIAAAAMLVDGRQVPDEARAAGARAIDRILAPDSEWLELWGRSPLREEAVTVLIGLRKALADF